MVRRRCRGGVAKVEGVASVHPPRQHACAFFIYRASVKVSLPFLSGSFLLFLQFNGF